MKSGFSLIECLVYISCSALVIVLLSGCLVMVFEKTNNLKHFTHESLSLLCAADALCRDILLAHNHDAINIVENKVIIIHNQNTIKFDKSIKSTYNSKFTYNNIERHSDKYTGYKNTEHKNMGYKKYIWYIKNNLLMRSLSKFDSKTHQWSKKRACVIADHVIDFLVTYNPDSSLYSITIKSPHTCYRSHKTLRVGNIA